jgi:hypothetical protein
MGLTLNHHLVPPVARGLLGSISCSGGPTLEQQRLQEALLTHLWERPDQPRVSPVLGLLPGFAR